MREFNNPEKLQNIADQLEGAIASMMVLEDGTLKRLECSFRLLNRPKMLGWLKEIAEEGGDDGEAARIVSQHVQLGFPLAPEPEEMRRLTRLLRQLFRSVVERKTERRIERLINA